jgi:hypothetical protein
MKTYEDGLREAWDLAQRITLAQSIRADAYTVDELKAIFNEECAENILTLSFDDVQKLLNVPKVGDVCAKEHYKCVITRVGDNGIINYVKNSGATAAMFTDLFLASGWKKTGENLSEVTAILDKLRGEKNV